MKQSHQRLIHTDSFQLIHSGTEYFSTLESLIDAALVDIHFQTYIFRDDETGKLIANALLRAAARGVKVYLLLDAYGSADFSKRLIAQLRHAGIEVRWFGKLFAGWSLHVGRRLHRKIVLADGTNALVGGINISNHYNKLRDKQPWLDFAVLLTDFPSNILYRLCLERWLRPGTKRKIKRLSQHVGSPPSETDKSSIKVVENDYLRRRNLAAQSYFSAILHAKKSLTIVGGYFLPGGKARRLLRRASRRGVNIKVIVAEQSDVALNRNAVQYLYQWLMRQGIKIYEYKPANVHGKAIVADEKLVSIGSYDLNNLSTYSNIELNLEIRNEKFAGDFNKELNDLIDKDCQLITTEYLYKRSNPWKRFKHWFCYHFLKSMFIMAVWFANRKDETYQ